MPPVGTQGTPSKLFVGVKILGRGGHTSSFPVFVVELDFLAIDADVFYPDLRRRSVLGVETGNDQCPAPVLVPDAGHVRLVELVALTLKLA